MTKRTKGTITVITANQLHDGKIVYLTAQGWHTNLQNACVAYTEDELNNLMNNAKQSIDKQEVVAVYEFSVELEGSKINPITMREKIRAGITKLAS